MEYALILNSLVEYYVNLLIIQYHNKPKARATIQLLAALAWANMVIYQVRDGFDWKTATGPQLDIVGKWVGLSRFYNGQLLFLHPWFSLIGWDSNPDNLQGGFSDYNNFETLEGGILTYDTIKPTQNRLTDEGLSLLIGLKIIKNNINHVAKEIDTAIYNYFQGDVYTVWENNKVTYYYVAEKRELLQVAMFKGVLPAPTGTQIELKEIIE